MTSFAVVKRVRDLMGIRKAGHTGTLDPLATGVLPICLNEATKVAGLLLAEDKGYEAELVLGLRTDTYDVTGQVLERGDPRGVSADAVEAALEGFRGVVEQRPPAFSALHHEGRRAYELARAGEAVVLPSREVTFHELRLVSFDRDRVSLFVHCSKGTYVRSLAEDLGQVLGCGASLAELRRVRSGSFVVEDAVKLRDLEACQPGDPIPLIDLDHALAHLPVVDLPDAAALARLAQGQAVPDLDPPQGEDEDTFRIRYAGEVVALGRREAGGVGPRRLFGAIVERLLRGSDSAGFNRVEAR